VNGEAARRDARDSRPTAADAQLSVRAGYAAHLLPAQLVLGVGLGFRYAPATDIATRGVDPGDAAVASGLVNARWAAGFFAAGAPSSPDCCHTAAPPPPKPRPKQRSDPPA
jgi:hypothetical protein